ncbi:MAG: sigma-70 family polymerase sigma factor [Frankiales bacterium]|nr:sigma-70 family polymerase sigma factor [Frankiales bacterium]
MSRERDEQRFRELMTANGPRLLAFARRRIEDRDAALDVVASIMEIAWRRLSKVPQDPEGATRWLFVTARGVVANEQRGRRRRRALEQRLHGTHGDDSSYAGPEDAEQLSIARAVAALPAAERELLALVAWDGFTCAEAASLLGITPAAARQRLSRSRARLRAALSDGADGEHDAQSRSPATRAQKPAASESA